MRTRYKKKVFIASSKEAYQAKALDAIIKILIENEFEPHPWYNEFPTGDIILERLIEITKEMDFAICYFSEDIKFIWRHEEQYGTAWNVVLEYGMFFQRLGKERVNIIQYGASHIPTDLNGLVVGKITAGNANETQIEIEEQCKEILKHWKHIPPLHDDKHGINKPIIKHKNDLDFILLSIDKHLKTSGIKEPLTFDEELIVNLYLKGLENVDRKFWTTTYLSSGFWVHKTGKIINANVDMLNRLNKNKTTDVKRLFLLRREFTEEITILSKKLIDYKNRKGGEKDLKELKSNFTSLQLSCRLLKSKGCEIRFAHDNLLAYTEIDNYVDPDDTEIAIYDDFRVDFFDGGKKKKITGLKTLTNFHQDFKNVKTSTEKYFIQLWQTGKDIDELLNKFDETFRYYETKVDYTLRKLVDFDHDSNTNDAELKRSEINTVKKILQERGCFENTLSYLDIGTCTGRYLFELKKFLRPDCQIHGFDSDPDCINYITVKLKFLENAGNNVSNIFFSQEDFLLDQNKILEENKKFDLITCMLGTLSHFGWDLDRSDRFNDSLQTALTQMEFLLSDNGYLILSNWTPAGIDNGLLSIYNQNDFRLLKAGTERSYRLKKRLDLLSFDYDIFPTIHNKLDIFVCRKKQ